MRKIIRSGSFTILLPLALTLILFAFLSGIAAQDEPDNTRHDDNDDMLGYVSDEGHLMLYDPRERTETKLLENVYSFVLSRDGRVAFTKQNDTDTDLYVFDPSTPDIPAINVSQNSDAYHYPLAWSPDGHYLAFASYQESDNQSLYIWDSKATTNITPVNGLAKVRDFYIDWSYDGRLAFTVIHGWSNDDIPAEIYLWDGNTTTNLSCNPKESDGGGGVSWSKTGKLMFGSQRDDRGTIYVWDGVSFKDGLPNIFSFIRLAPELKPSHLIWLDDGMVAFTTYRDTTPRTKEIILWDLERETIVERYPVASEKYSSWLAEGGQMILSSHLASGIPSVYLEVENLEGEILFSEHVGEFSWSSDGYLAYCGIEEGASRVLSIWDGEKSWVVARVSYQPVRWQNEGYTFSCNNG